MKQEHEMTPGVLVSDGKIPDVLVPSVATREMKDAALAELERQGFDCQDFVVQPVYQAMLSAAPAPVERLATDGGRNQRFEGLFEGETPDQRNARLASAAPVERVEQKPYAYAYSQLMHDSMGGWERKIQCRDPRECSWIKAEDIRDLQLLYTTPQPAPTAAQDAGQLLNDLFEFFEGSGIDPGNDIAMRLASAIATPQPSAPAPDVAGLEREAETERQIQRACGELPEGWTIQLELENGAGYAVLYNPQGVTVEYGDDFDGVAAQIEAATDCALAAHQQREGV